jgi:tetratricopeptide (TPR) repeat protein
VKKVTRVQSHLRLALTTAALALSACATTAQQQRLAPEPRPVPVATESQPAPAVAEQTAPAPQRSKDDPAEALFVQAVAAYDAGRLDEAREGFEGVLKRAPQSLNAQFNLGLIAERQGRLADAQAAYEKVRFLEPGHVPMLLNLGRLYRQQERYPEAIALYEAGLKSAGNEHQAAVLNNLSTAYRLAGKAPQAEATARRVLARHPGDAEAHKNLALAYYDQGRFRLAETVLTQAGKDAEQDPGLHNELGRVYLKLEQRPRALAQFQRAVALDERFAPGYENLGALALTWRDYAGAERAFGKVVQLEPQSPGAWLSYAWALDGQKGTDPKKGLAAGEAFEKVLALRAESSEAVCGAGWAYAIERTGWDKAEDYLRRCKAAASTSPQDKQLIESKLQGLAALRKSAQAAPEAVGGSGAQPEAAPEATPEAAPAGEQAAPEGQ